WTIDLPEGTSAALACTLVDTIRRLLGEKEGDKHATKLRPGGPPYQIRFQLENRRFQRPEYIQGFVKLLIRGCEGLGIRDEAALARFLRKCPQLSSAFGNSRFYFQENNVPATSSRMDVRTVAACIEEAVKQIAFQFIVLFGRHLGALCNVAYNTAVSVMFYHAQKTISAMNSAADEKDFAAAQKNLDAAKEILICLAKISQGDVALEMNLLEFVVNNWKDFPEITDIVHPHLSGGGKKIVESLVATINFEDDYESLKKEIDEAGLTTRIDGGFHFARKDGQALDLQPDHLKLAMRLATLWAINEDDNLEHAFAIMRYVFGAAESEQDLKASIAELKESIKSSPLPQVKARYEAIAAVVAKFEEKAILIKYASELKQKFGYGIRKDNESGKYRLEPPDDAKVMKVPEFQALRDVLVFAARAGEVALIIETIALMRSAPLSESVGSNHEAARDLYRTVMGWLRQFSPEAVGALNQAFAKEFRSRVASDISKEMKDDNYWGAMYLYDDFKDDTLIHELIQLIPADQRKDLGETPTIDDVLARL
ncbi:MAG TPA: hypothetical protein VFD86_08490, partial [Nitrospira sp.]|nr:hypothetical protein [Nitrospira sp.]